MKRNERMTRSRRYLIDAVAALFAALACLACQAEYTVAEGTTEAGNPAKVAGRIYDAEGNGTVARVRLIPEAYRSSGPRDYRPYAYEVETALDGSFSFEAVASGRFNLEAAGGKGGRMLVRSINIVKDTTFENRSLVARDPSTLKVDLSPVPVGAQGYIYISGTSMVLAVSPGDLAQGYALIDSVPSGSLPYIWFAQFDHPAADDILLSPGTVATPGDTTFAARTGVLPKSGVIVLIPPSPDTLAMDSVARVAPSSAVADFPLLLRLDSSNLDFSRSHLQGRDCRFSDRDGNPLAFSIESWDSTGGRASVWLHMDTVKTAGNPVYLRMGADAGDTAAKPPVFDAARGWIGVWHFTESASAGQVAVDSTQNRWSTRDASWGGNDATSVSSRGFRYSDDGVAGWGVRFNGMDDGLATSKPVMASDDYTVSMWFRTSTSRGGILFAYSRGQEAAGNRQIWMDDYGRLTYHVWTRVSTHTTMTNGMCWNDGKWHFLAATWRSGRMTLHVDGRVAGDYNTGAVLPAVIGKWSIGHGQVDYWKSGTYPSSLNFEGEIDEARISSVVRSAPWIKLSYDTQKPFAATHCAK